MDQRLGASAQEHRESLAPQFPVVLEGLQDNLSKDSGNHMELESSPLCYFSPALPDLESRKIPTANGWKWPGRMDAFIHFLNAVGSSKSGH